MAVLQSQLSGLAQMQAEIALLKAQLAAKDKAKPANPIRLDKYGNVCVGGMRHRADNWLAALDRAAEIREFIDENAAEIETRRKASA